VEGEADRGAQVSALAEKKKKERRRGGPARGDGRRAVGPSGRKGKQGMVLFFSFSFSNFFFKPFSFQIQIKLFLKNFINFLETTQATKNHASQLMMHKHLLSLSLLNYVYYFRAQFK
jgi:hypothetical protein